MAAEGFPLVGDAMYGGAIPQSIYVPHPSDNDNPIHRDDDGNDENPSMKKKYRDSEMLALQCCELSFLSPETKEKKKKNNIETILVPPPSGKECWKTFRLEEAWWSPYLQKYNEYITLHR